MKEIKLKSVKLIGDHAFYGTSLKIIKNKHIQELNYYEFADLISEVEKVSLKRLNYLTSSAFANCTINKFDAPKLKTVEVDSIRVLIDRVDITFTVGKKNFQDFPGIL